MSWIVGWAVRAGRAAGLAFVVGASLASVVYAFRERIGFFELPKPEELGWLVGLLAFVAFLLTPLPRDHPVFFAAIRALAGSAAIALVFAGWSRVASPDDRWTPLLVGLAAFAALLLPVWMPAREDRP